MQRHGAPAALMGLTRYYLMPMEILIPLRSRIANAIAADVRTVTARGQCTTCMYVATLANGSCPDGHVARVHMNMVNGQYAQAIFIGGEEKLRSLCCFVQSGPSSHFEIFNRCCPWSIEIRRPLYRQNSTKRMILHVSWRSH